MYVNEMDSPWVGQEQNLIKMVNENKHEKIKDY